VETDTDDAAGAVTVERDAAGVGRDAVERALERFRGRISQVPPAYSALKRAGRPLYDYARAGTPIIPEAREVTVHALEMLDFDGPTSVRLRVRCSKGTYVRSLARDLGRALEVGGHVTALRRTRSGPFSLLEAATLEAVVAALGAGQHEDLPAVHLPDALAHLERRVIGDAVARDLRLGRRVPWQAVQGAGQGAGDGGPVDFPDGSLTPGRFSVQVALVDGAGRLVAVAEPRPDGSVRTLRVFGVPH